MHASTTRLAVSVLALALVTPAAAADRHDTRVTHGPTTSTRPDATATGWDNRDDARAIHELESAAQRLRDATHAMAAAQPGKARTEAIRQANAALATTQSAMANLPYGLLVAGSNEGDYAKAADRLEQAAQDLRDASHALAAEPAGERRNAAMRKINEALVQTQGTMLDAYTASAR